MKEKKIIKKINDKIIKLFNCKKTGYESKYFEENNNYVLHIFALVSLRIFLTKSKDGVVIETRFFKDIIPEKSAEMTKVLCNAKFELGDLSFVIDIQDGFYYDHDSQILIGEEADKQLLTDFKQVIIYKFLKERSGEGLELEQDDFYNIDDLGEKKEITWH